MFTSKVINWFEKVDVYGVQRVVFHKALFILTVMVFAYWLFRPTYPLAYTAPLLVAVLYEVPRSHPRERNKQLYFLFFIVLTCTVSFYLLFPFKFIFLFYTLYFFVLSAVTAIPKPAAIIRIGINR